MASLQEIKQYTEDRKVTGDYMGANIPKDVTFYDMRQWDNAAIWRAPWGESLYSSEPALVAHGLKVRALSLKVTYAEHWLRFNFDARLVSCQELEDVINWAITEWRAHLAKGDNPEFITLCNYAIVITRRL